MTPSVRSPPYRAPPLPSLIIVPSLRHPQCGEARPRAPCDGDPSTLAAARQADLGREPPLRAGRVRGEWAAPGVRPAPGTQSRPGRPSRAQARRLELGGTSELSRGGRRHRTVEQAVNDCGGRLRADNSPPSAD